MTYQTGDSVFVSSDNGGARGIVIDVREQEPRYLVRIESGREYWFFTYEVMSDDQPAI